MVAVIDAPVLLSPSDKERIDFNKPILIRWQWSNSSPITTFHVCIGTEPGTWNVLNGEVGLTDHFYFTPPTLPDNINQLYIQVIYKMVVTEDHHAEEEAFRIGDVIIVEKRESGSQNT